jgi:predicted component of type VI protein secretion system
MATKKAETNIERKEPKVSVMRAQDYGVIYADAVRTTMGLYDLKLTFSVQERLPNDDILVTEVLTVAVSPQHMKDFTAAMNRNVESYEAQFIQLQDTSGQEADSLENRLLGKSKK